MTVPFCDQFRIDDPHCENDCKYYISKDDADNIIRNASAEPNCQKCAIKELWEETEKEDLVAVVRCKDCIHRIDRRSDLGHFMCEMFYGQGDVSDENFCQWGERKGGAECD